MSRQSHLENVASPLTGWMGHEAPFAFDLEYRPVSGINRMTVGTPAILALSSLHAALDIFDDVDMADIRAKSISLSELFISEVERTCPQLSLASPGDPSLRGSQVSFRFEEGYAVVQALIAQGVIGDFRAPDVMRFGFTPLYLSHQEIVDAVAILADILTTKSWDRAEFKARAKVT